LAHCAPIDSVHAELAACHSMLCAAVAALEKYETADDVADFAAGLDTVARCAKTPDRLVDEIDAWRCEHWRQLLAA
jgi:hypothetical protein